MLESVDKQGRTVEPKVTPKVEIFQKKKKDCPLTEVTKNPGTELQEPGETHEKEESRTLRTSGSSESEKERRYACIDTCPRRTSGSENVPERGSCRARYTLEELKRAQDMDLVVSSLKRLMKRPKGKLTGILKELREGIQACFRQAKDRLFLNGQGILCLRRSPADRNRFHNHAMIMLPQVYQGEILYRTHNEMGHQGVNKVVARIQQRHDWLGLQTVVNRWIKACPICQQRKNPAGPRRFALQSIVSNRFNELVQMDHVKMCKSRRGNRSSTSDHRQLH